MGERKVLNKYYPPDFDPSKLPRRKRPNNSQIQQRMMLPVRIQCNKCGNYMGEGKKFNSRQEIAIGETYLGIKIFRFYFKCSTCSNEITMKTDPKNSSYVIESGARMCYQEEEFDIPNSEIKSSIEKLEEKASILKKEMKEIDELYKLKSIKSLHHTLSVDEIFAVLQKNAKEEEKRLEEEDEALVKSIVFVRENKDFVRRITDDDFEISLKKRKCSNSWAKFVQKSSDKEKVKNESSSSGLQLLCQSYKNDEED